MRSDQKKSPLTWRLATSADLSALRAVMALAIDRGQAGFLSPEEVEASHHVMGLDTQLIEDGTYFLVEADGQIAGCGGWSYRATLFGGDHSVGQREPRELDPVSEPARVRAMYTHPSYARQGVGRLILRSCEAAAFRNGFRAAELMATLAGEPLYRACDYRELERISVRVDAANVPLIRMGKTLQPEL